LSVESEINIGGCKAMYRLLPKVIFAIIAWQTGIAPEQNGERRLNNKTQQLLG